jgi:hypothetical protein
MEQPRGTISVPRNATRTTNMRKFKCASFLREFLARCTKNKMPGADAGHEGRDKN